MKIKDCSIFWMMVTAVFLLVGSASADVPAWFVEDMHNDEAILAPGTTTYCDKDFRVENMGKEMAEVHVILGNGFNYSTDQIEPGSVKSYALEGGYPQAGGWEEAKNTHIDEARIVNGTAGHSDIKVLCK